MPWMETPLEANVVDPTTTVGPAVMSASKRTFPDASTLLSPTIVLSLEVAVLLTNILGNTIVSNWMGLTGSCEMWCGHYSMVPQIKNQHSTRRRHARATPKEHAFAQTRTSDRLTWRTEVVERRSRAPIVVRAVPANVATSSHSATIPKMI